jgi:hypothetical protein
MQSAVASDDWESDFSSHQPRSYPGTYAIIVSGERLIFTREQLESEPNNKFAEYFFGSTSGPSTQERELRIENEPALFKLIQAHLRGHNILPIRDGFVPYMTVEGVLENLLKEAEYYALGGLVQKLQNIQNRDNGSAKYILGVSTANNSALSFLTGEIFPRFGKSSRIQRRFTPLRRVYTTH